ncbi:hypothetical protein EJB05_03188, partial [Eragrostis curvula]
MIIQQQELQPHQVAQSLSSYQIDTEAFLFMYATFLLCKKLSGLLLQLGYQSWELEIKMTGIFESLSVGRAWEKLISLLHAFSASSSSSASQDDIHELRKLERTMRRIRATLHDAEEHWNIREESAKLRLRELKEVARDAEDVVEEYEYEVNRYKVQALERYHSVRNTSKRKHQEENEPYSMDASFLAPSCQLVFRAREITDRFKEILNYSDHFILSENDGERRFIPDISNLQHTSSLVSQKTIVGRHQDKKKIVEQILSREEKSARNHVHVMAIVGMGGLGKTTLAQLVYNNLRVRQSFDKQAWISVSENFDVSSITRNIFSSLTNGRYENTQFSDIQKLLADEIHDKRVLLVLDNVWNERRDHWELLCMPLSTTRFCQILVTSRSEAVARLIQTVPFYHLKCLSFDESWSLFKQAAFSVENEHAAPANILEIGKAIVKKCKGLPLAIKTLGSMLRYEIDEKTWEVVLENELWYWEQPRKEILPALELSYKNMPLYLRRCFVSLSLFPKVHSLDDTKVIRLWKLLDLLHCDGSDDEYEVGQLYLKQLVQRSILEVYNRGVACFYRLHDLIHDLACYLSEEEFYRFEGNTLTEIGSNVLYMSIPEGVMSTEIPIVPHSLRAIIMMGKEIKIKDPKAFFMSCKKLRALHIEDRSLVEALPDFMGCLKLLRHLSFGVLRDTPSAIPICISMLQFYNLQTLDLSVYNSHKLFFSGIGHLINLHNLLPEIRLSRCGCSCNIRELRNINKIRKLRIYGLGNISHIKDAIEAQMQSKTQLRSLDLGFSVGMQYCQCVLQLEPVTISHEQLLESLRPHRNLCELSIWDYESQNYPSWLGDDSFCNLTRIVICRCGSQYLPTLSGLPSLKHLKICDMACVERIGEEFHSHPTTQGFPSLRNLEFVDMFKWSEWSGLDIGDFHCLQTLSILSAPKLRSLPLVSALCELYIEGCPSLSELPALPSLLLLSLEDCSNLNAVGDLLLLGTLKIRQCSNLSAVVALPSLTILKIRDCSNLSAVTTLPSLTSLELRHCLNLSAVKTLPRLTNLKIHDCPNLNTIGSLPSLSTLELATPVKNEILHRLLNYHPSLECLKITYQELTSLPIDPQSLPALTKLHLGDCPNLQYCDGLAGLTTLQELEVWGCPKLTRDMFAPKVTENH